MSLFQDDIINKLISDADFFVDTLNNHIFEIGKKYSCVAYVSKKRLEECHGFWIEDIRRALNESFPNDVSTSPYRSLDIFKYASFLSFWLRRFTPIVRIVFIVSLGDRVRDSLLREHDRFAIFGNEIAALLVGIHLCVFHVINIVRTSGNVTGLAKQESTIVKIFPTWLSMRDYVMISKHKALSPYAIYLIYKSIFQPPIVSWA